MCYSLKNITMTETPCPPEVFIDPDILVLLPAYLLRRDADVLLLRKHIEVQDFESIRVIGHKLRGNGSLFGLDSISKTGEELESAAGDKDIFKVRKYIQELFEHLEKIKGRPQEDK